MWWAESGAQTLSGQRRWRSCCRWNSFSGKQLIAATGAHEGPGPNAQWKEQTLSLQRSEKEAVISEVSRLIAKAQTLVLAEYGGITVADMTKLRVQARSNGVRLSVLKNTLARRAVAGSAFDVVAGQMTGPLIYGFSEDAVAAAKVVAEFA